MPVGTCFTIRGYCRLDNKMALPIIQIGNWPESTAVPFEGGTTGENLCTMRYIK